MNGAAVNLERALVEYDLAVDEWRATQLYARKLGEGDRLWSVVSALQVRAFRAQARAVSALRAVEGGAK